MGSEMGIYMCEARLERVVRVRVEAGRDDDEIWVECSERHEEPLCHLQPPRARGRVERHRRVEHGRRGRVSAGTATPGIKARVQVNHITNTILLIILNTEPVDRAFYA